MKSMLIKEAANYLNSKEEEVVFDGEKFTSKDKVLTLSDLANRLYYNENQHQLTATESYVGHKSPPPFMAGYVEIELDTETGEYDILHYVSVVDCGVTINPMLAKGQVEGGIVQGLGMACFEDVKYSNRGKLNSNSFLYYKIPSMLDVKKLTTEFAESFEESGPYGAKSVGEIGIDTPPAAIANAVANATGVRINKLPVTPEKIFQGLNKGK